MWNLLVFVVKQVKVGLLLKVMMVYLAVTALYSIYYVYTADCQHDTADSEGGQ